MITDVSLPGKKRLAILRQHCLSVLQSVALLLACAACSAVVYTKQPAGNEAVRLDRPLWEGIWVPRYEGAGGPSAFQRHLVRQIYIKVQDADKGILRVSWVEAHGKQFELAESVVHVRRQGHWLLASLPWQDGNGYWWARIEIFPSEEHQGSLVIWAPRGSALEKPITDGVVAGTVRPDGKLIEIAPDGIAWMQSMDDSTGALWMVPTVYERIKLDNFEPPAEEQKPKQAPKQ